MDSSVRARTVRVRGPRSPLGLLMWHADHRDGEEDKRDERAQEELQRRAVSQKRLQRFAYKAVNNNNNDSAYKALNNTEYMQSVHII